MTKRTLICILILTLGVPLVACSAKPSEKELYDLSLKNFQEDNMKLFAPCAHKDNDRAVWVYERGLGGAQLYKYFVGVDIVKNKDEEGIEKYPYIGNWYYISIDIPFKEDLRLESVRKNLEIAAGKLKVKDIKDKSQIEVAGYSAQILSSGYRWGKKTKTWQ
jgi:hypothetical protein